MQAQTLCRSPRPFRSGLRNPTSSCDGAAADARGTSVHAAATHAHRHTHTRTRTCFLASARTRVAGGAARFSRGTSQFPARVRRGVSQKAAGRLLSERGMGSAFVAGFTGFACSDFARSLCKRPREERWRRLFVMCRETCVQSCMPVCVLAVWGWDWDGRAPIGPDCEPKPPPAPSPRHARAHDPGSPSPHAAVAQKLTRQDRHGHATGRPRHQPTPTTPMPQDAHA